MKRYLTISLLIVFALTSGQVFAKETGYQIKIANVNDFVMKQHYRNGTYLNIEEALDQGVTEKTVWWWDKKHIEKDNLAGKAIETPDKRIQALVSDKSAVEFSGIKHPEKTNGWSVVTVKVPGKEVDRRVLVLEIGANGSAEHILTSIGIKDSEGKIVDLSISPEALLQGKKKSAFLVRKKYFDYKIEQKEPGKWLKNNLQPIHGVSVLVLKGHYGSYRGAGGGDSVILTVDLGVLKEQSAPTVILGWKQGNVIAGD
jgi:hypothetical protein